MFFAYKESVKLVYLKIIVWIWEQVGAMAMGYLHNCYWLSLSRSKTACDVTGIFFSWKTSYDLSCQLGIITRNFVILFLNSTTYKLLIMFDSIQY